MFKDIDDGRAVIHQIAVDEADTLMRDTRVQFLLDKLIRQFWLTSDDRSVDVAGATRLGGAPDLPRGTAWPLRPVPPDAAQRAEEMKQHFDWIARHIVRELPFEFLAQIDLAEAARYPDHARGLPAEGRLLFFWDGVFGLHTAGPAACRVIWDASPIGNLERLAIPSLLEELEVAYDPSGRFRKPYVYPVRAMRLAPIVHLPDAMRQSSRSIRRCSSSATVRIMRKAMHFSPRSTKASSPLRDAAPAGSASSAARARSRTTRASMPSSPTAFHRPAGTSSSLPRPAVWHSSGSFCCSSISAISHSRI